MSDFLSQNAALLIAILGLLVTIIVQWDVITKRFSNFTGTINSAPQIAFKLLVVSFSGTFVASIFMDHDRFSGCRKIIIERHIA